MLYLSPRPTVLITLRVGAFVVRKTPKTDSSHRRPYHYLSKNKTTTAKQNEERICTIILVSLRAWFSLKYRGLSTCFQMDKIV